MPGVDGETFKAAMGTFAAGVTIITTVDGLGRPFGLTATAFSSVSKDPPLCLVCVSHEAEARPVIHEARRFAVSFLSRDQSVLSARFAQHGLDKFEGVPWEPGMATGCPLPRGVLASLECTVHTALEAGDHDVFIGRIVAAVIGQGAPLAYFRGQYSDVVPQ